MSEKECSDVYRAQLYRQDRTKPWGFRLQGGIEFNKPLTLLKVMEGSVASRGGLRAGDVLISLCGHSTNNMSHKQAQNSILNSANTLDVVVQRPDPSTSTNCVDVHCNNIDDTIIVEKSMRSESFANDLITNRSAVGGDLSSLSDVERSRDSCKQAIEEISSPVVNCTESPLIVLADAKGGLTAEQRAYKELQQKQLKLQQLMQQGQQQQQIVDQHSAQSTQIVDTALSSSLISNCTNNRIDSKSQSNTSNESIAAPSERTESSSTNLTSNTSANIPNVSINCEDHQTSVSESVPQTTKTDQLNPPSDGSARKEVPLSSGEKARGNSCESGTSGCSDKIPSDSKQSNIGLELGDSGATVVCATEACVRMNLDNSEVIKDHNANIPVPSSLSNSPAKPLVSTNALVGESAPSETSDLPDDASSEFSDETSSVIEIPVISQPNEEREEIEAALAMLSQPRELNQSIRSWRMEDTPDEDGNGRTTPTNNPLETLIYSLATEQNISPTFYSTENTEAKVSGYGSLPPNFRFSDSSGAQLSSEEAPADLRDYSQTAPWRVTTLRPSAIQSSTPGATGSTRSADDDRKRLESRSNTTVKEEIINIPISLSDHFYRKESNAQQSQYQAQSMPDDKHPVSSQARVSLGASPKPLRHLTGNDGSTTPFDNPSIALYPNINTGVIVTSTGIYITPGVSHSSVSSDNSAKFFDQQRGHPPDSDLWGLPLPAVKHIVADMNRQRVAADLHRREMGQSYGGQNLEEGDVEVLGRDEEEEILFRRSRSVSSRRSSSGLDGSRVPAHISSQGSVTDGRPHRSALKTERYLNPNKFIYPPSIAYNNIIYTDVSPRSIRRYSLPSGTLSSKDGGQRRVRFADPPASSVIEIEGRRQRWPSGSNSVIREEDSSPSDSEYNSVSCLKEKLDRIELENALASAAMKMSRPFPSQSQDYPGSMSGARWSSMMSLAPGVRSHSGLQPIPERLINVKTTGDRGEETQQIKLSDDRETIVYNSPNGDFVVALCPDSDGKFSLSVRQQSGIINYDIPAELNFVIPTGDQAAGGTFSYSISKEGGRMIAKEPPTTIKYSLPPSYEDSIRAKASVEHPRTKSFQEPVLVPQRVSDLRAQEQYAVKIGSKFSGDLYASSSAPSSPTLSPRLSPMLHAPRPSVVSPADQANSSKLSVAAVAQRLERLAAETQAQDVDVSSRQSQPSSVQISRTERVTKMQPGIGLRLTTHKPNIQVGPLVGPASSTNPSSNSTETSSTNNGKYSSVAGDALNTDKTGVSEQYVTSRQKNTRKEPENLGAGLYVREPQVVYRRTERPTSLIHERSPTVQEHISPRGGLFEYQTSEAGQGAEEAGTYRLVSSGPGVSREQARRARVGEEGLHRLMASLPPSGPTASRSHPRGLHSQATQQAWSDPSGPTRDPQPTRPENQYRWSDADMVGPRRVGSTSEGNPYQQQYMQQSERYGISTYPAHNIDVKDRRWSISQRPSEPLYYGLPYNVQPGTYDAAPIMSQSVWDLSPVSRSSSDNSDLVYPQQRPQPNRVQPPQQQRSLPPGIFALLDKTFTDKVMQWQNSRGNTGSLEQSATYKLVREMDEEKSYHDF